MGLDYPGGRRGRLTWIKWRCGQLYGGYGVIVWGAT